MHFHRKTRNSLKKSVFASSKKTPESLTDNCSRFVRNVPESLTVNVLTPSGNNRNFRTHRKSSGFQQIAGTAAVSPRASMTRRRSPLPQILLSRSYLYPISVSAFSLFLPYFCFCLISVSVLPLSYLYFLCFIL